MTFVQRLATAAGLTEQRLTDLLSECGPESGTRLGAAMRHALLGGGKRFRPFLLLESARLFGMDPHAALDAAAAFECVHCYSLVHDDLPSMDNDDLRRGQPTAHKAFDEWTAILAGDALLTLAFEIAARPQTHPDAGVRAELGLVLAHAAGGRGMVLGQMLDLEAEKRGEPAGMSAAHVRRLQALKTGALIAAACEAGAVMAGAADEQRARLRRYGENLGLAFQTADDLLDAQGDAAAMGKATGKDSAAGKATLVGLIGIGETQAQLAAAVANAERELEQFGAKAAPLIEAAHFAASREH
ncbi:MAG: polyprenyl synthetase family protein [Hyphomicrobium sp.]